MKLSLIANSKPFDIYLRYKDNNSDFIINEINKLKKENEKIKNEINILKGYQNNGSNPLDIKFLTNVTNESYTEFDLDNTFTVFKSINDISYLIYSTKNKSIICQDLNNQQKIKELKKCHNEYITNIRHYLDKINHQNLRDLIMSVSAIDNNLKLWDIKNWECILNLENINKKGCLYSACFLKNDDELFILTSNANKKGDSECIKVFDLKGNKIKDIKNSNRNTLFVDNYYDEIFNQNYVISGNINYVKSFDFNKNEIYHKYHEKNDNKCHGSIIINYDQNITKLMESSTDRCIRIWDFHLAILIKKIIVYDGLLYGLCLWNNKYLFVGAEDKTIKLIDLNGSIIKSLTGHKSAVLSIKKLVNTNLGEWLVSQGLNSDEIKIWNTS
jgi:hypothetical protein